MVVTVKSLPAHHLDNPDCDPQRPGYCVEVPSTPELGHLFACELRDQTMGMAMWVGGAVGFCRATGPVKVWSTLYGAQIAAEKTNGRVVSVPRRIGTANGGPVLVWEERKVAA